MPALQDLLERAHFLETAGAPVTRAANHDTSRSDSHGQQGGEETVERITLNGITLECEIAGEGEPVILIHGSFIAGTFHPLLSEASLTRNHRLINYHRQGYVQSSRPNGMLSVSQQASDCRSLLRRLGVSLTHVVGHSFGGVVALQLALDAPELVGTLALLEPALAVGASGPGYRQSLASSVLRYREFGPRTVVNEIFEARWPGYRVPLEEELPGAFDQAVADAPSIFESELRGLLDWSFGEVEARQIKMPVLSVLGGKSEALSPRFVETHQALCAWLDAEEFILPGATHFLQVERPQEMAEALAGFFARHPLA
jgi:pimeloyl-ACP methyl ester carboxylesterase